MTIANVEMAEAWDGAEGDHWTEHAERYESIGPGYWDALAHAVAFRVDDQVVDIGCGTGRSTRDTARITTSGEVLGVDLSRRMLERAEATARAEGLTNVRFEQADAQVHPFPTGAFDAAISVFGAMFFADPVAAFANIARALRPDARARACSPGASSRPTSGCARSARRSPRAATCRRRRRGCPVRSGSPTPTTCTTSCRAPGSRASRWMRSTRRCGSAPMSTTRSRSSRRSASREVCCTTSSPTPRPPRWKRSGARSPSTQELTVSPSTAPPGSSRRAVTDSRVTLEGCVTRVTRAACKVAARRGIYWGDASPVPCLRCAHARRPDARGARGCAVRVARAPTRRSRRRSSSTTTSPTGRTPPSTPTSSFPREAPRTGRRSCSSMAAVGSVATSPTSSQRHAARAPRLRRRLAQLSTGTPTPVPRGDPGHRDGRRLAHGTLPCSSIRDRPCQQTALLHLLNTIHCSGCDRYPTSVCKRLCRLSTYPNCCWNNSAIRYHHLLF